MTTNRTTLFDANRAAIRRAGLPDPVVGATVAVAAAERRDATVHVPPGPPPPAGAPLVCMLHGCTQDAAGFAAATRMNDAADRHDFVVVYPHQTRRANQLACWNWFERGHRARDRGEPAAIAAIVEALTAGSCAWPIDGRRVFAAGLSAGGAMAVILAATYPDVFAAVAVHSGLPFAAATGVGAAFAAMARGAKDGGDGAAAHAAMGPFARAVPSIVIHGTADRTVAPVNGEHVLRQTMAANRLATPGRGTLDPARPTQTARLRAPGGLAYTRSEWSDAQGRPMHEALIVDGLGHAWSGGAPRGSFTDPRGPDATAAIWGFFDRVTRASRIAA